MTGMGMTTRGYTVSFFHGKRSLPQSNQIMVASPHHVVLVVSVPLSPVRSGVFWGRCPRLFPHVFHAFCSDQSRKEKK